MLIIGVYYDNCLDILIVLGVDDNVSGSVIVLEVVWVFFNFLFLYILVFCLWDEEE